MELWVVDSDKMRLKLLKDAIKENGLSIEIKQFDVLSDAQHREGTPDFILINFAAIVIAGGLNFPGYFDDAIGLVHRFWLKHSSSNFCIQSAVKGRAKDMVDDMKGEFIGVIIEAAENTNDVIDWLKKYAKEA